MLNSDPQAATLYAAVRRHPLASDRQRMLAELGVARTLLSGRSYRRAAEHVRAGVLEAKPGPDPELLREALQIRADCLAAIDEPAEAAEAYRRLAEAEAARDRTASVRAALHRAAQLVKAGKADAAARETLALLADPPPSMLAEARFQAAVALEAAGKTDGALKYFAAVAELPGELRGPALVRAAELEMGAGRWAPALANAGKALESCRPGTGLTARIHMIRGRALLAGARPGDAAACFRQAVDAARAQPDSPAEEDPELGALLGLAGALRAQAVALRKKGRTEEALKPLSDAAAALAEAAYLRGESPDPGLLERAAAVLEEAAAVLGDAGRKQEAAERKRAADELRELAGRRRRERR